jgi:hypothetical protein
MANKINFKNNLESKVLSLEVVGIVSNILIV